MRKHTVIIVDDEQSILNSLKRLLREEQYSVVTALSGKEALEFLKGSPPVSLIITDYRMPQMDGIEFLKEIKRLYPETLRMVLTGYADTQIALDAINEGEVYRFITKPWSDDEIKITIAQALVQYDLFMDNRELIELVQKNQEFLNQIKKEHPEIKMKDIPTSKEGKYVLEGKVATLEEFMKRYFSGK